jgi:hypothetical protein
VPNGTTLPGYGEVNSSVVQKLKLGLGLGTALRLDVLNVFDEIHQILNGTGVKRRHLAIRATPTILAGLTQRFQADGVLAATMPWRAFCHAPDTRKYLDPDRLAGLSANQPDQPSASVGSGW